MKKYYYNYEYEILRKKKKITINIKLFLRAAIHLSIILLSQSIFHCFFFEVYSFITFFCLLWIA